MYSLIIKLILKYYSLQFNMKKKWWFFKKKDSQFFIFHWFNRKYSCSLDSWIHSDFIQVTPQRNFKFKEKFPPIYKRLSSQVGISEPRLKKGNPYGRWYMNSLLWGLRDHFLQDFRSNEKSITNEVCLELSDERTAW